MILTGETEIVEEEPAPVPLTLSTINHTWTD